MENSADPTPLRITLTSVRARARRAVDRIFDRLTPFDMSVLQVRYPVQNFFLKRRKYLVKIVLKVDQNVQMCLMAQIKAYTILIKKITSISRFITMP